jgi:tungstate transport system ATP-binding protein
MLVANEGAEIVRAGRLLPIEARGLMIERAGRRLLSDISLTIDGDGLLALMGPNGAGKSLLMRVLTGLLAPDTGAVLWNGTAPNRVLAKKIGIVLQHPVLLRRSARANLEYVLKAHGIAREQREQRARAALASAGLESHSETPARLLSGGEQRRLAIARALVTEPDILFLDEPTANLDPRAAISIEDQICGARENGVAIVLITHDIGQARRLADEIAFLFAGRLMEQSPARAFLDAPDSRQARAFLSGDIVL